MRRNRKWNSRGESRLLNVRGEAAQQGGKQGLAEKPKR
jgi:hypothetical protein